MNFINGVEYKNHIVRHRNKYIYTLLIISLLILVGRVGRSALDSDAIKGSIQYEGSEEEQRAELQEQVENSRVQIKINEKPDLDKDSGITNIIIQNSIENKVNQRVEYYDKNGSLVYSTRELYPGDEVLSAEFPGIWEEGEHLLDARIWVIDTEMQEELLVTNIEIKLTVK